MAIRPVPVSYTHLSAADYLRSFLPVPADCEPLCAIAAGYSDFTPAPLPDADDAARIIRL